ncbi:hypothetical protein F7725_007160 [Dissostichus mawsoni]|uniref:Myosin motor domain-containing protein n=1 Tax=Dissostichus mawsoni TaxID=36200 RepID=A0A7J5XYX3_DISMA|nr:hypothetical protein F7725_007160 [Dissostichus mawsoni]
MLLVAGHLEAQKPSHAKHNQGPHRHELLGDVKGFVRKVRSPHPSLNDSLEGEIQAFLIDEDQLHTYDDLTKVNPVTPTTVLKCLQARYRVKVFYTHAGCTLVALNPFQPIPDLYTLDVMKEYHCAPQPQEFKPHIFIVAEEAYRNVQNQLEPVNQSLVVSGESGAGKTWTSRCLMKYYATVAAASSVVNSQDTVERIERRLLVGASVQTYLLEKTRVACQPANERNFHIFYQMLKGATDEQRKEWKMPCGKHFVWLPNSEKTVEEDSFQETVEAMVHLGIKAERQRQLFRILSGILQLGNLNFSSMDESQPCDLDEQSKDFLQRAADLLCVPAEELLMSLRVRTLKAGKQSVLKPCSRAECNMRRDCLAKVIYAQLFEWLEEYVSEGLEWSFVKYQDNQSCLDLLEGSPVSVFSLLNEESRLNRASDAKTMKVRLEKELSDNANISWDKFSKQLNSLRLPDTGDGGEKQGDPVPPELIKLLQKSENSLLHHIFTDKETEIPTSKGLSKVTVVSKFKNSLESLMRILHTTTPHYTRCIKPNPDCKPLTFKKEEVIMQLEACGIVETIHISAAGFPIRIPFKGFMQRYGLIAKYSHVKSGIHSVDAGADYILRRGVENLLSVVSQHEAFDPLCKDNSGKHNSWVHCGRTKVFLTQLMLDFLEYQRKKVLCQCAFSIQCCWLRYQRRRRCARLLSATRIQAVVRSWLVRRQLQRWNRAAAVIQNTWRMWRALLKALAETELDDAKDLLEADVPQLNAIIRERGSVQLSFIQEPVSVRGWPLGLALASAPSITMSLTATGFQKMVSVMASLNLPSRRGEYKLEPNQYSQELASIRAQPKGSVKLHYRRSPLLYADRKPDMKSDMSGFNAILLEKTL